MFPVTLDMIELTFNVYRLLRLFLHVPALVLPYLHFLRLAISNSPTNIYGTSTDITVDGTMPQVKTELSKEEMEKFKVLMLEHGLTSNYSMLKTLVLEALPREEKQIERKEKSFGDNLGGDSQVAKTNGEDAATSGIIEDID